MELESGDILPADFVVLCCGTQFDVPEVLPKSALTKAKDGSVVVDSFLEVKRAEGSEESAGDAENAGSEGAENAGDGGNGGGNSTDGVLYCAGDLASFPDPR